MAVVRLMSNSAAINVISVFEVFRNLQENTGIVFHRPKNAVAICQIPENRDNDGERMSKYKYFIRSQMDEPVEGYLHVSPGEKKY